MHIKEVRIQLYSELFSSTSLIFYLSFILFLQKVVIEID